MEQRARRKGYCTIKLNGFFAIPPNGHTGSFLMMPKRKKKKKEKELPETFSEGDNRVVLPFSRLMKRTTKLFSFNDTHTLADSIDHSHITIY